MTMPAKSKRFFTEDYKARAVLVRARMVQEMNGHGLRLICGEMTAQEIRTVRAIVNYILRA